MILGGDTFLYHNSVLLTVLMRTFCFLVLDSISI